MAYLVIAQGVYLSSWGYKKIRELLKSGKVQKLDKAIYRAFDLETAKELAGILRGYSNTVIIAKEENVEDLKTREEPWTLEVNKYFLDLMKKLSINWYKIKKLVFEILELGKEEKLEELKRIFDGYTVEYIKEDKVILVRKYLDDYRDIGIRLYTAIENTSIKVATELFGLPIEERYSLSTDEIIELVRQIGIKPSFIFERFLKGELNGGIAYAKSKDIERWDALRYLTSTVWKYYEVTNLEDLVRILSDITEGKAKEGVWVIELPDTYIEVKKETAEKLKEVLWKATRFLNKRFIIFIVPSKLHLHEQVSVGMQDVIDLRDYFSKLNEWVKKKVGVEILRPDTVLP